MEIETAFPDKAIIAKTIQDRLKKTNKHENKETSKQQQPQLIKAA